MLFTIYYYKFLLFINFNIKSIEVPRKKLNSYSFSLIEIVNFLSTSSLSDIK